jgi:hypothetical protein
MWPCQNIFHIQVLVMHSFATPPIKLKLGQQIGGGLLIANCLDQSLWRANEKHWVAVRSHLLHSFLQVHSTSAAFTSHGNLRNYADPKPFSLAKPACVGFSSSNFTVQDHIPMPSRQSRSSKMSCIWYTVLWMSDGKQQLDLSLDGWTSKYCKCTTSLFSKFVQWLLHAIKK